MAAQYKTWKDQGENIGIQCAVCTRTHWTGKEPATDPLTNQPCSNCQLIKDEGVLEKENQAHKQEDENAECAHGAFTQPRQEGVNYDN